MTAATDLLTPAGSPATFTSRSASRLFWERFREDKAAILGAVVILTLILIAAVGGPLAAWITGHPSLAAYPRVMEDEFGIPKGPNSQFWFGADGTGRDLFVRTMYGARTSLLVGVAASLIAVVVGLVVGMAAGYFGGWIDMALSRVGDVMLSLPSLLIAIGIAAACALKGCLAGILQPGIRVVIGVIAFFTWPYIARIVRSTTLSLREKEFVEAARSLGASDRRIIFREILPNLVAPITIWATLLIPANILFEAALSFLGLGVPVTTASWGSALSDAAAGGLYRDAPWMMIFPGIFLVLTTLAFNLLGDGLRDALDPRSER
jgi:peptide/nickel transport system permease protein